MVGRAHIARGPALSREPVPAVWDRVCERGRAPATTSHAHIAPGRVAGPRSFHWQDAQVKLQCLPLDRDCKQR